MLTTSSARSHAVIFERFPQLSISSDTFQLADDVMEEIDDLLINPGRIIIKETVGNGVAIYRRAQKCFIAHDSRFLLLGKFGEVFKGVLDTNTIVAVKSFYGKKSGF